MNGFLIRAGVSGEVPDLVDFIAEQTESDPPENALYVAIYRDGADGDLIGCLIFYSPFREEGLRGVKLGGALPPGRTWGTNLRVFIQLRDLIERVVFDGFGYDIIEADVQESNVRTVRFLLAAGFEKQDKTFTDGKGRTFVSYRIKAHEHPFRITAHIGL